jgi:hypothetical protein
LVRFDKEAVGDIVDSDGEDREDREDREEDDKHI